MRIRRTFYFFAFLIFYIFLHRKIFPFYIKVSEDSFNNFEFCPACYGTKFCPQILNNLELATESKIRLFKFLNAKNVYYGQINNAEIVAKKLAHDWELEKMDKKLCDLAEISYIRCNPKDALYFIYRKLNPNEENRDPINMIFKLVSHIETVTDILKCKSKRLLEYGIEKIYGPNVEDLKTDELLELVYTILVNPEPIILQLFPPQEGWPFPRYHGTCGRVLVEEYIGPSLSSVMDADWPTRLQVSYQLLQLAFLFTHNHLNFSLYLTDVSLDNFALSPDGSVFLIDAESLLFADKVQISKDQPAGWREPCISRGEGCHDCLSFSVEDLCSHVTADHNYYAICHSLLIPGGYASDRGLLHDIPPEVEASTELRSLIQECAMPSDPNQSRLPLVPRLLQTMRSLI
ncbi:C3orf58 [Cordylochernes scorpioides]|uniref:C3orf58 n=1 Tax=Cordylochernes scorpioides TaxID=51811 RepID=A0ABY6LIG3_9ARAC|nr:C3orf58 [Cordylochernes scorpioides]